MRLIDQHMAHFERTGPGRDPAKAGLRILFLTDSFLPHAGGARVYYYNLLKQFIHASQHQLTILTKKVPDWKDFDKRESTDRFRIVRCGQPLENWKYYQWPRIALPLARVLPMLAAEHFDLIYFGDLYPQGVLSFWLKRMFGKPYLAFCHGEEITQVDGRRYQPRVRDTIFREAAVVIAANEFARQNLLRIGIPEERIHKITPGVDCLRFRPLPIRGNLLGLNDLQNKKALLTVARLVPRKGHKVVLEAVRKLLPEIPNLIYLIVGTGPEEAKLRKMTVEWSLQHVVRFIGSVKDEYLSAYYNACDLYVMPNSEERGDIEGFGMVFLEANACGKAVVGGRSGGAAEAVIHGRTGMLVNPHDPCELASTLRMLLNSDALRTKIGEQGMLRAQTEFSWSSRARQLADVSHCVLCR